MSHLLFDSASHRPSPSLVWLFFLFKLGSFPYTLPGQRIAFMAAGIKVLAIQVPSTCFSFSVLPVQSSCIKSSSFSVYFCTLAASSLPDQVCSPRTQTFSFSVHFNQHPISQLLPAPMHFCISVNPTFLSFLNS